MRVLFFAGLKARLGVSHFEVKEPYPETVADLQKRLQEELSSWAEIGISSPVLVAVNKEMAQESSPIKAGDEVAFFPPVTGG